jgi:DNA modification methylase
MMTTDIAGSSDIASAASDRSPIRGLTHTFYRYPARFSPVFVRAVIEAYTEPGDIVLDPFMGGGTTLVEAMVLGRRAIGSDVNELSIFLAKAKVTNLEENERKALKLWANKIVPRLRCSDDVQDNSAYPKHVPRNLTIPAARWLRKTITQCIDSIEKELPTLATRNFARCVLLNVGQWAMNGRRRLPCAAEFRDRVRETTAGMLLGMNELGQALENLDVQYNPPVIRKNDAERLDQDEVIRAEGLADLVVTSPPYPGIHMLYHRWQVDGRKETDAPYWIAACSDGAGTSYYNFADRRRHAEDRYFEKAERSFSAIRRVMRKGGILVQMVAFTEPKRQMQRYLSMLERAGFDEHREKHKKRTWRDVPGRRWHANSKGNLASSKEVVLIHSAR